MVNTKTSEVEIARIDYFYPKGFYGNKRFKINMYSGEGWKPPHFHVVDFKTGGTELDIEVLLKDLTVLSIHNMKNKIVKEEKRLTWDGYEDIESKLIEFLTEIHPLCKIQTYYTMLTLWDSLNTQNMIPDDDIKNYKI